MKKNVKKRIWAVMLAVCVCMSVIGMSPVAVYSFQNSDGVLYYIEDNDDERENITIMGLYDDSISDLQIPTYIEHIPVLKIGSYAFKNCIGLTSVTLPNSLEKIWSNAFEGCNGLTSITLPNSITYIGYNAFSGCSGLTSVVLPGSITSIENEVFSDCSGLTSIVLPDGITTIGSGAFAGCSGLTSITLPDSITSIESGGFRDCSGLTSITLSDGVLRIKEQAFANCSGLTGITLPDSVMLIKSEAFSNCKSLTDITIPDGIERIEEKTFLGCSRLASITLPGSVTYIAADAIDACSALTDIYYAGSEEQWRNIDNRANMSGITIHYGSTGGNSQGGSTGNGSGGSTGTTPPEEDKPVSLAKVNLSAASNVSGGIELTWSSVKDAEQYDIYRRNAGGSWKKIATVEDDTTRYVDTSVKSKNGTTYGYRVQAVSQDVKGAYSSEKTVYRLTTPKLSSVKNNKSKKVTVKWKKASKIDGYEVQYSKNANFKKATIKKVKSASKKQYVMSKLKKKNTYYIRIRTYMKVNKTTFYSAWSNAKQVKIKK